VERYVTLRISRRALRLALVVLVTVAVTAPVSVYAASQFTDVPGDHLFHDDIVWLADSGVTRGCNPPANDMFCPESYVTRGQMAAFMRRLAASGTVDAGTVDGQDAVAIASRATGAVMTAPAATDENAVVSTTIDVPVSGYIIATASAEARVEDGEDDWIGCWISFNGYAHGFTALFLSNDDTPDNRGPSGSNACTTTAIITAEPGPMDIDFAFNGINPGWDSWVGERTLWALFVPADLPDRATGSAIPLPSTGSDSPAQWEEFLENN